MKKGRAELAERLRKYKELRNEAVVPEVNQGDTPIFDRVMKNFITKGCGSNLPVCKGLMHGFTITREGNTFHMPKGTITATQKEIQPMESHNALHYRNWDYEVAHPDMVCPEEIHKYVSRANPVAVAKTGTKVITYHIHAKTGKPEIVTDKPSDDVNFSEHVQIKYTKRNLIFVHTSLVTKAMILGMKVPEWVAKTTHDDVYGGYTYDSLKTVTNWAKWVKSMEWEDKAERVSVRVIIPKI